MILQGTRVVVMGAAHGMGQRHCVELARRGARVAALDIDEAALAETISLMGGPSENVWGAYDVSNRAQVEEAVAEAARLFGGLDAIVSNAGTTNSTDGILDTDDEEWDKTFAVHVGGARNLCRAAIPHLEDSQAPRIVIISSMWAQRGPGYGYAYCSAKGALLAFAKNLAVELGPKQILVNAIAPGSIPTRQTEVFSAEEIAEDCKSIPLVRWAHEGEVTKLVCFLVSSETSYITGQTLGINGGQVIA